MKDNVITISIDEFYNLLAERQELVNVKAELKKIQDDKERRALSYENSLKVKSEEKIFRKILSSTVKSHGHQHYKDPQTLGRMLKERLTPDQRLDFFTIFKERLNAVLGLSAFKVCCEKHELNEMAVAQYVVTRGERAMNSVFKNGLESISKLEKLKLINEPVFQDEDLVLEQYKPKKHPENSEK
nr:hypothetical protein [uncultured Draconibacterium sp.]